MTIQSPTLVSNMSIEPLQNRLTYTKVFAGLGAFGTALQNFDAVQLFLNGLLKGGKFWPACNAIVAVGSGGICSGLVNYWMNIELLEDFYNRLNANQAYQYQR